MQLTAVRAKRGAARRARPTPAPLSPCARSFSRLASCRTTLAPRSQVVPFLLEDKFKELGALYSKVADWVRSRGRSERENGRALVRTPRPPLAPDTHPASLPRPQAPHAVSGTHGGVKLATGQNPASSEAAAKALMALL